jgi:hypothetical protein
VSGFVRATLAALLGALVLAPAAGAGTYDVYACRTAAGAFPNHSWALYATGNDFQATDCNLASSDPQLLIQTQPNQTYGASRGASLTFTAAPGTTIATFAWSRRLRHYNPTNGAPAGFAAKLFSVAQLGSISLEGTGAYDPAVMNRLGSHGAWYDPSSKIGGDVSVTAANYAETVGYRGDATTLKVTIGCWNDPCSLMTDNAGDRGTLSWGITGATVTIDDPVAPKLDRVFPSGIATPNTVVGGDEPLTFDASDNAGIRRAELLDVTGGATQVVGARDFACDYSYAAPCQTTLAGAQIPVNAPSGGQRTLRVRLYDAGGNVTDGATFIADIGGPLNGTNASAGARLTATFASNRHQADVGFGKSARIRGRVTDATGAAIAGATIQVLDRELKAGTTYRQRTEVTTGADGRFTVTPGPGAARSIRFEYRARRLLAAASASDTVQLRVAASSTLSISPKRVRPRGTITITGRLRGTPLPRSGKVVDLQAYEGGKWRTFDTARARKGARFTSRYRFLRAGSGASFLIRARIRRDDSYPYYLGYSPRVRVRVL